MGRIFFQRARALVRAALLLTLATPAWVLAQSSAGHAVATPDAPPAVRLFVRLKTPAIGELCAARRAQGAALPDAAAQRDHSALVRREQDALSRRMAPYVRHELGRLRVAVNGIKVLAPATAIDALRKIDGVRSVTPVTHFDLDNAASVDWVQAPALWQSVGDAHGVRIAIIDTGIDYLHANFGGAGNPADYAANDKSVIEAGSFPTAKVIGGWDFAGPTYNSREDDVPQPDPDPLDGNGHGSHVAGTAAGLGVPGRIGPGVAKGAALLALKVFSDEGGSTDLVAEAIDMALDPNGDGALDDRVDVINMSLGARYGDPADPSALASATAADNGVIVVASAGNNGDNAYVTGSPAVHPQVISVAATLAGGRPRSAVRVIADDLSVSGLYDAREGAGPVAIVDAPLLRPLVQGIAPAVDDDGNVVPGQFDDRACRGLRNRDAVRGNIVLTARDGCSFESKYANVQRAGGAGILVYNDVGSTEPFVMGGIGVSGKIFTIPGMMIGGGAGEALKEALALAPVAVEFNVSNTLPALPELADRMTFFSSRGPAHGGARFKPDLAAPGRYIVSTDAGTGIKGRQLRGTSMAAPHVAGAAALLRQRFPALPVSAIKALLQNATVESQFEGPGSGTVAPLSRQGTGVIRVADAANLTSYATPAGISFGYLNARVNGMRTITADLINLSAQSRVFTVQHKPRAQLPGVRVACPDSVSVDPAGRTGFAVTLSIDDIAALPPDGGRLTHQEIDGWCVLSDGLDTLRVGYMAALDPASDIELAATSADNATVTLINAGPGRGRASGFKLLNTGGTRAATRPIAAVGYRLASIYGLEVFQLAIALAEPWEAPAHVTIKMFVDANRDGRFERVLYASDWSQLGFNAGTYVTGVYDVRDNKEPNFDSGYGDWFVDDVDFNDQVMVLPYSLLPEVGLSFLKPPQRSFAYRLVVTSRDGSYDVSTGLVELDAAPVTDAADVIINGFDSRTLALSGAVPGLWLLPMNVAGAQYALTPAGAR